MAPKFNEMLSIFLIKGIILVFVSGIIGMKFDSDQKNLERLRSLKFNNNNAEISDKFPFGKAEHEFVEGSSAYIVQQSLKYMNDPFWPDQWYLNEETLRIEARSFKPTMKIAHMHYNNIKGQSVGVIIVGNNKVNFEHADFSERFKWSENELSYYSKPKKSKINKNVPQVYASEIENAVAGIIGMKDQNQYCGVGILPRCKLGNIVTDASSSKSSPEHCITQIIKRNPMLVDLFVHVWKLTKYNPTEDIIHMIQQENSLNFFSKMTVLKPQVMGSGDHGIIGNTCQCNEYANLDTMFVFGSVQYNGYLTTYTETGASIIAVTFSTSNGDEYYNNFITVDYHSETMTKYAPKRTTSISAAVGAGIIGLLINYFREKYGKSPSVSDIAFLIAFSSENKYMRDKDTLWFKNGVNLNYSLQAGFGIPNMKNAVILMNKWTSIATPVEYKFSFTSQEIDLKCRNIKKNNRSKTRFSFTPSTPLECQFFINNNFSKYIIQHVGISFSASLSIRGSMSIYLISPAGTVSCLLEGRPYDNSKKGYSNMYIRSNHYIGEQFGGMWTLKMFIFKSYITSPNKINLDSNIIDETIIPENKKSLISLKMFRAILVESIPIKLTTRIKQQSDIQANFELLKQWVDYKYSQMRLTDPSRKELNTINLDEVMNKIKNYTQNLSKISKSFNSNNSIFINENGKTSLNLPVGDKNKSDNFNIAEEKDSNSLSSNYNENLKLAQFLIKNLENQNTSDENDKTDNKNRLNNEIQSMSPNRQILKNAVEDLENESISDENDKIDSKNFLNNEKQSMSPNNQVLENAKLVLEKKKKKTLSVTFDDPEIVSQNSSSSVDSIMNNQDQPSSSKQILSEIVEVENYNENKKNLENYSAVSVEGQGVWYFPHSNSRISNNLVKKKNDDNDLQKQTFITEETLKDNHEDGKDNIAGKSNVTTKKTKHKSNFFFNFLGYIGWPTSSKKKSKNEKSSTN